MDDAVFLYVTAPDAEIAGRIARTLVGERLAACVNIHGPMRSVFEWEGKTEEVVETPLIVKTTALKAPAARDRILALHPYETPCVAALPVARNGSSEAFLDWIEKTTTT